MLRLIPEYEPVRKLSLCFVHDFFNTRFHYGRAQCEIIRQASPFAEVEVFVSPEDLPFFEQECARWGLPPQAYTLNADSPGRAILYEYVPCYARDETGGRFGLLFRNPWMENPDELRHFAARMTARDGFTPLDFSLDFATAHLAVNEDLVLLSDFLFQDASAEARLRRLRELFPGQSFHVVPALAGDVTGDLDMYLWPFAPRAWIVSEYPAGSPQAESIRPALDVLRQHGHTIQRVPGLEPIIRDDINTMPNYANGVILNGAALVPAYGRPEDAVVARILQGYGYRVLPVDCSDVILSNSAIHCISKTVPA